VQEEQANLSKKKAKTRHHPKKERHGEDSNGGKKKSTKEADTPNNKHHKSTAHSKTKHGKVKGVEAEGDRHVNPDKHTPSGKWKAEYVIPERRRSTGDVVSYSEQLRRHNTEHIRRRASLETYHNKRELPHSIGDVLVEIGSLLIQEKRREQFRDDIQKVQNEEEEKEEKVENKENEDNEEDVQLENEEAEEQGNEEI